MKPTLLNEILRICRVPHDGKVRIRDLKTRWKGPHHWQELCEERLKDHAAELLRANVEELGEVQELLAASDSYSVLVIFQAMDAAGKDGTIKHVMSGVNPQGCQVFSFKRPSDEELDHTFLWRCMKALPERGRIGIFNRSYYEEVLVVRVHPEFLDRQRLPNAKPDDNFWNHRYEDINAFERHLTRNGTHIIKFFLHVSKAEQKRRFLERIQNPKKYWKFSATDVAERDYWKQYMRAYEAMLNATSTKAAPWYAIPADYKYIARTLVSSILTWSIKSLNLKRPKPKPDSLAALKKAQERLVSEG